MRKMVENIKSYDFKFLSPKNLMNATYKAVNNFQIRTIFEAKEDILNQGKYSEKELCNFLDSMIDAETARKFILEKLKGKKPSTLEEIIKNFNFPPENTIRDIIYLREQGFIEELREIKIEKQIINEELVEIKKDIYRYQVREITDHFQEHFFCSASLIYDSGFCCQCGFCQTICPLDAIKITDEFLEVDDGKCINCCLCYSVCPQSFSFEQAYNQIKKLDSSLKFSEQIGYYKDLYTAKTTNYLIHKLGQDGGAVTSLLYYLLENKLVDAVVAVSNSEDRWKPEAVIVENVKDLYKTAGTNYAYVPILKILEKTKKYKNIAIVGLPCKIKALTKGNLFLNGLPFYENIKYKIGLFCMESFTCDNLIKLIEEKFGKDINEIIKMNIKKSKFIITLKSGEELSMPLYDFLDYARDVCSYCEDLTAEHADISVGGIGSRAGWSSLIIRTEKGQEIFDGAINTKLIESQKLKYFKLGRYLIEKIAKIKKSKYKPIKLMIT